MTLLERIRRQHQDLKARHLWRRSRAMSHGEGLWVKLGGRTLINFSGNDYLGLAREPRLIEAFQQAAAENGVGSGASRLVTGTHPLHESLEQELADWLQRDEAIFFASGYQANLALIQSFMMRGDRVVCDRLNHASLVDAAQLSRARVRRFHHGDVVAAERQLQDAEGATMLVTDGVFSMDGDMAPVQELARLARQYNTLLAVDDAHGLGVLGHAGRGVLDQHGLDQNDVPLLVGTCGKSLGTSGAFIAGGRDYIQHLRQLARSWIYTTAPPPAIAAATLEAVRIVRHEPSHQLQLQANIQYFREIVHAAEIPMGESETAIQPLLVRDSEAAVQLSAELESRGFLVAAMRPPTVPKGKSRLRITLSAAHRREDIDALVEGLKTLWSKKYERWSNCSA